MNSEAEPMISDRYDRRPWGEYLVLADEPDHKIKRITVMPDKRLSLQRHNRRSEHWYVLSGGGFVTLNDREIPVGPGDAVDIPQGSIHRLSNTGNENLVFIEIQVGDYFGEDDIERFEDDFGRA